MEAASDDAWTLTVFANPQVLSLLGAGWTYREILRVNTLSSRRVKLSVSPQDTVLAIKRRLEDQEGVPVEDQELRRVNADGATETVMRDEQTLRSTGAHSGETVFWVNAKDGDASLFSAGTNSDGCRMASSAGSEVLTLTGDSSGGEAAGGSCWWEGEGTASGVLCSPQQRPTAAAAAPAVSPTARQSGAPAPAGSGAELADTSRVAQATEARLAALEAEKATQQQQAARAQPAAASAVPALKVGRRVRIEGLTSERSLHLNRTQATVLAWLPELERYSVQLDGGLGQAKLRQKNLKPVALPRTASAARRAASGAQRKVARGDGAGEVAVDPQAMLAEVRAERRQAQGGGGAQAAAGGLGGAGFVAEAIDPVEMMRQMRREAGRGGAGGQLRSGPGSSGGGGM